MKRRRWHRKDHAFLGFREPDFPWCQPLVFQRCLLQFETRPRFCAHLADGRGEATTSTVGDSMIELAITCLDNHIGDLLFSDWCSDLDSGTSLFINLQAHFTRGEGGTVHSITSGAST